MDFKPFIEGLQNDLKEAQLGIPNIVKCSNRSIRLCHATLYLLKNMVLKDDFETVDEEIQFFKEVKTIPSTQLIFFSQIRSFELEFPKGNIDAKRKFIKKRLNLLNRFFRHHMDFAEYIESGSTHFDEQYFTRKYLNSFPIVSPSFYFHDPDFSTPKGLLLAELKANNLIISYLQDRLMDKSKLPAERPIGLNNRISLQWTSTKSALTELIYALHYNGVINNGKADIKEIAIALQQVFHFDLGDFYKIFSEIKARKNRRTKFLNDLASGLQLHMEKAEE